MLKAVFSSLSSFLRGLYFIRFALLLWIFPIVMVGLDQTTPAAAITRGIMTPETRMQAGTAAFMLFSCGVIALLLTRLVAINGPDRFPEELPRESWLPRLLGQHKLPVLLFIVAHLPGLVALICLALNMHNESVQTEWPALVCLAVGIGVAYFFWLVVGLIYLWTFDEEAFGKRGPVGLIFPHIFIPLKASWYANIQSEPPPLLADWFQPLFRWIAKIGGRGFAQEGSETLFEGHRLASVSIFGLLLLYLYLFSFTSPVPLPGVDRLCNGIVLAAILAAAVGAGWSRWPATYAARLVKIFATCLMLAFFTMVAGFWWTGFHAPHAFSVLGSILILVIALLWILSTAAFAFDSTRVPVLSATLLVLLLLKAMPVFQGEHYFTVFKHSAELPHAPTPDAILKNRLVSVTTLQGDSYAPLIVITAEGGGIHSAAWTARVLMKLEESFRKIDAARPFHANILLASGVSGGSAGLLPFLREYTANKPFDARTNDASIALRERVVRSAECSSLQAAAWGLTYYDILNFISPVGLPYPASGADNHGYDRSWALEQGFNRNLNDQFCFGDIDSTASASGVSMNKFSEVVLDVRKFPKMHDGYSLTLSSTAEMLAHQKYFAGFPAFTFNTTAAETGGRFLLANYELTSEDEDNAELRKTQRETDLVPAESFLHAFGHENNNLPLANGIRSVYADLPLATAARLSGTFPYVSSASRIPTQITKWGFHFVDGGYFDNDGTSSVVEFLYLALKDRPRPSSQAGSMNPADTKSQDGKDKKAGLRKLPILLIEIRNDWDIDTENPAENLANQDHLALPPGQPKWTPDSSTKEPTHWGPDHQLSAPLQSFWNAGHQSDTRRNRRELCMLEGKYKDQVFIHHMVFDYRNDQDTNQALSWDLTPNQKHNIRCALGPEADQPFCQGQQSAEGKTRLSIDKLAEEAAQWFHQPEASDEDSCASIGLGPAN